MYVNFTNLYKRFSSTDRYIKSSHVVSRIVSGPYPFYRAHTGISTQFRLYLYESFIKLEILYPHTFLNGFFLIFESQNRHKIFMIIFLLIKRLQLHFIIWFLYVILCACWHNTIYRISYSILYFVSCII